MAGLLQAFAPELKGLRKPRPATLRVPVPGDGTPAATGLSSKSTPYAEVVASFTIDRARPPTGTFGLTVLGGGAGSNATRLWVMCTANNDTAGSAAGGGVGSCEAGVDVTGMGGAAAYRAPLPMMMPEGALGTTTQVDLHVYLDGCIVEAIFNNRTAFVATVAVDKVPAVGEVALLPWKRGCAPPLFGPYLAGMTAFPSLSHRRLRVRLDGHFCTRVHAAADNVMLRRVCLTFLVVFAAHWQAGGCHGDRVRAPAREQPRQRSSTMISSDRQE